MLKSIILFFRKRKIRRNLQNKRLMQFPDITKYPIITILVDESQKKDIKAMETFLKMSFVPKRLRFIVIADVLPDNILQSDFMVFVSKDDFDKLGILKKEKEDLLKAKVTPEEYKHLRVRVTGFSDYFVNLNESIQDDIIERTTQK